MTLNFHDLVRGAIQAVNEDQAGTIYIGTGFSTVRGIRTPTFTALAIQMQVQAQQFRTVDHQRGLVYAEHLETIYAYGNFDGVDRPDQTGGCVAQNTVTGQWFAVTQVIEWWPGWCQLSVTRQLNAANIAALLAAIKNGANPP